MSTITPVAMQSSKPPIVPKNFSHNQPDTIRLYPLSNYVFTVKENQPEEDASVAERLKRLNNHYAEHGMRRTAEAILLCHEHSHPHVLLLQIANSFFKMCVNHHTRCFTTNLCLFTGLVTTSNQKMMRSQGLRGGSMNDWLQMGLPLRMIGTLAIVSPSGFDPMLRLLHILTSHRMLRDQKNAKRYTWSSCRTRVCSDL